MWSEVYHIAMTKADRLLDLRTQHVGSMWHCLLEAFTGDTFVAISEHNEVCRPTKSEKDAM